MVGTTERQERKLFHSLKSYPAPFSPAAFPSRHLDATEAASESLANRLLCDTISFLGTFISMEVLVSSSLHPPLTLEWESYEPWFYEPTLSENIRDSPIYVWVLISLKRPCHAVSLCTLLRLHHTAVHPPS